MPGPPKKPRSMKLLSGTLQPCRDTPEAELMPALADVPAPPDLLPNGHAVREWNRAAPILVAHKLLSDGSLAAFGVLCSLFGVIVQHCAAGMLPKGTVISQYRALAGEFGLTPASSRRFSLEAQGARPENRFNRFQNNGRLPQSKA